MGGYSAPKPVKSWIFLERCVSARQIVVDEVADNRLKIGIALEAKCRGTIRIPRGGPATDNALEPSASQRIRATASGPATLPRASIDFTDGPRHRKIHHAILGEAFARHIVGMNQAFHHLTWRQEPQAGICVRRTNRLFLLQRLTNDAAGKEDAALFGLPGRTEMVGRRRLRPSMNPRRL